MSALLRRLAKLKGRSLGELGERVGQQLSQQLERFDLSSIGRVPSDAQLLSLGAAQPPSIEPPFGWIISQRAGSTDRTPAAGQLLERADRILAGRFDLLGYRDVGFGSPIDWHLDPISGKRAPKIHWSRIPYLNAELAGDHKVVWEINRHQHFYVLGRAYLLTRDERYARCFAEHLASWMDANPPKLGINWASSLEVSYRAISWLWAFQFFRESPSLTPQLLRRALGFLHVHGRHLERYLSTYFSPNTHLTGEALGLLYLGVCLPEFRRAGTWRRKGWDILERELPRQVYEDGVYFEQASYYQRYTVDIYLHALLLARSAHIVVPPAMLERFDRCVGHMASLMRADGTIPIIGDDDGGRLTWLEEREPMDVRSALATAARVLDRPEYARRARGVGEEVGWMVGEEGVRTIRAWQATPALTPESRLYEAGGYAIMRDGSGTRELHAVIDCGPLGTMNCGHAHSDALSIEIAIGGCPVLVDPGTFTYTTSPEDRDGFRHSRAHNTLTVDGSSASVPAGPFSWAIRTDARADRWFSGSRIDYLVCSHPGFERLPSPATHQRTVLFVKGEYWVVVDSILTEGEHECVARFHAAIGSTIECVGTRSAMVDTPCAEQRARLFLGVAGDVDSLFSESAWVSPVYGRRELAPCAVLRSQGIGRRDMISVLAPLWDGESIEVRETPADGGRAVVVDRPGKQDVLLLRTEERVRMEGMETDADVALVRRPAPEARIQSIAVFGDRGAFVAEGVTVSVAGGAQATRQEDGWVIEGDGRIRIS